MLIFHDKALTPLIPVGGALTLRENCDSVVKNSIIL